MLSQLASVGGWVSKQGAALAVLCALFAGGCASPNRVALPVGKKAELSPAVGVIGMRQQEIGTSINRSNLTAAGGGLILALIDAGVNNSRAKRAEGAASSIRDSLIDYRPADVLAQALKTALASQTSVTLEDVQVVQIKDVSTLPERVKATPNKSVVVLDMTYELQPDFGGTRVVVTASAHPANGKPAPSSETRGKLPPLCYFNVFSSTYRFPFAAGTKPEEAAKVWSSTEGRLAKEVLDRSFTEIAAMIAYDLDVAAPAENALYKAPNTAQKRAVEVPGGPTVLVQAFVEKSAEDRVWVRCPRGELCGLPL